FVTIYSCGIRIRNSPLLSHTIQFLLPKRKPILISYFTTKPKHHDLMTRLDDLHYNKEKPTSISYFTAKPGYYDLMIKLDDLLLEYNRFSKKPIVSNDDVSDENQEIGEIMGEEKSDVI